MHSDVFISFASEDRAAADAICSALEKRGLQCWLCHRDILPGQAYPQALTRALGGARAAVLVFSEHAVQSEHVAREIHIAATREIPLIPFQLGKVKADGDLQYFVSNVQSFVTARQPLEADYERFAEQVLRVLDEAPEKSAGGVAATSDAPAVRAPTVQGSRVALLYKRNAQPDERLLAWLEQALSARGHQVFIDRHMTIGEEWAKELKHQVTQADAVIPLLSVASVNKSEMLEWEVRTARQHAHENGGRPRLLPVRVDYREKLTDDLAVLDRLQQFFWSGDQDNERLLADLERAFRADLTSQPVELGPPDTGVMRLKSPFYIHRDTDERFTRAVDWHESTVLVKGARQMGKTSLLARGLGKAREQGTTVVFTDFQRLDAVELDSMEALFRTFIQWFNEALDLNLCVDDVWRSNRSAKTNLDVFMRQSVLERFRGPLIWAMDEVDRLFSRPFASDVFALLRSWHNARAFDVTGLWNNFTLVIAYATEAHLFITDINQSPFNIGTRLALEDFTLKQFADLHERYGSPLPRAGDVERLFELLNGQPYLSNRGLYEIVDQHLDLAAFEKAAEAENGLFGDHLRRMLVLLVNETELTQVIRDLLEGRQCPSTESFFRLRSAGILAGNSAHDARLRCRLYERYLRRHLL